MTDDLRPVSPIRIVQGEPPTTSQARRALTGAEPKADVTPLAWALEVIGEPWSFLILQEAFFGVRRFENFQRNLGVARNTLADRLARLVAHNLLEQRAYQTKPVRCEYRLTERGFSTYPYALSLMKWGDNWLAGAEGPPVLLKHKACGKPLRQIATCRACHREIRPEDISIHPSSAREPASPSGGQVRYSSRPQLYTAGRPSSVSRALAVIGDRWGFFIVWLAFAGISKFDHFQSILGIARTILAARLERLTELGVLERRPYRTRPLRHDYHLTAMGQAFCIPLLTLFDWGQQWSGASDPKAHVLHKSCGEPLHVEVICAHCRTPIAPRDVEARPASAAALE